MAFPNTLSPVALHGNSIGMTGQDGWEQDGSMCTNDHGDDNSSAGDDPKGYTTTLTSDGGAASVKINGFNAAIVTSKGSVVCGGAADPDHTDSEAKGGSPSVFIEGEKVHRRFDWGINPGQGVYNIVTGSENVLSG